MVTKIINGIEFERIGEKSYAVRPEGENFVNDYDEEYYVHVHHDGETWVSSAVYDGEVCPVYIPEYIEICKELEGGAENAPGPFELKNTESWTENQFVERDPWNQDATSRIVLCVNWEDKTVNVETRLDNGSYPMREHNGLDYTFSIPDTTDFEEFPEYYSEHIKPCIKELSNAFEATWNGSNFVGRFNFNEAPEDHGTEFYVKTEHINDLIREAPQTEKVFYLDVGDSFADYRDIVEVLENEQIDFMTVDLDNPENLTEIREVLEEWSTYIMDDDEFRADLLRMRESILSD